MHEHDTRSPMVAEPAVALRAPALRPIEAAVLQLQRDVGNRVTAGIVSSKLERPHTDPRPPGAADFAKLIGDQAVNFGQFAFTHALTRGLEKAMDLWMWRLAMGELKQGDHFHDLIHQAAQAAATEHGVVVRQMRKRDLEAEITHFMDVYNEAWGPTGASCRSPRRRFASSPRA